MRAENPFYNAFVDQINSGTTSEQRRASRKALDQIFFPLAEKRMPPPGSRCGVTPRIYLNLCEDALRSQQAGFWLARDSGNTDEALALGQARIIAAANHARRITELVRHSQIDQGAEPGRFQVKAAELYFFAVADLRNLAGVESPLVVQPDGGALLAQSINILHYDPRTLEVISPDRLGEIYEITADLPLPRKNTL